MIENFNGGIIDINSVVLIINKLKLYIENEELAISNIINSLSILDNYYSGENDKHIDNKRQNLHESLTIMLENRKKYVEYLEFILKSYIDMDEKNMIYFNDGIN